MRGNGNNNNGGGGGRRNQQDDGTVDERETLKKHAEEAGKLKNVRASGRLVEKAHEQAKAISAKDANVKELARNATVSKVVESDTPLQEALKEIKDAEKRHRVHLEVEIAKHKEQRLQDDLLAKLIRQRSSANRCPAPTRDGPCDKLLVGNQTLCKAHWGTATRVSTKLLPSERQEILTDRKRAREGSNQKTLLDILLKESKSAKLSEGASGSSAAVAQIASGASEGVGGAPSGQL
jgi:hypothetical protein